MTDLAPGQDFTTPATRLRLGVGWDKERTAGFIGTGAPEVDLDATAVQFAGDQLFDLAFYNHLATRDGSVVHLGDNKSGAGEGDDEVITVDLGRVYARVDTIVLMVSSYQGHTLEWINRAYCRVTDLDDEDRELAKLVLTAGVPETGLVIAKLVRAGSTEGGSDGGADGGWRFEAVGRGIDATVPTEAVGALRAFL